MRRQSVGCPHHVPHGVGGQHCGDAHAPGLLREARSSAAGHAAAIVAALRTRSAASVDFPVPLIPLSRTITDALRSLTLGPRKRCQFLLSHLKCSKCE